MTTDRDAEHINSLSTALALAVDAKDSYTRSHCQTVSQLCVLIATELALAPALIGQMRLAGLLHDVGKIGIPDAILTKPAALTDAEYEQMKRHAVLGAEIAAAAGLATEARWIRHHHERYDGTGYPDRLAGKDIPLQSTDHSHRRRLRSDDLKPPLPRRSRPRLRDRRTQTSRRHPI